VRNENAVATALSEDDLFPFARHHHRACAGGREAQASGPHRGCSARYLDPRWHGPPIVNCPGSHRIYYREHPLEMPVGQGFAAVSGLHGKAGALRRTAEASPTKSRGDALACDRAPVAIRYAELHSAGRQHEDRRNDLQIKPMIPCRPHRRRAPNPERRPRPQAAGAFPSSIGA
jgi:hypothetical protein